MKSKALKRNIVYQFLQRLLSYNKSGFLKTTLFLLLSALTEGIGLLMLIPLLNLIGVTGKVAGQITNNPLTSNFREYIPLSDENTLFLVLVVFVALISVQAIFRRLTDLNVAKFTLNFVDHLRSVLYRALSKSKFKFFSKQRSSDLQHVLTVQLGRIEQATYSIMRLVIAISLVAVYLFISLFISIHLTIITLAVAVVLLGLLRRRVKKSRDLGVKLGEKSRLVQQTMLESFSGMRIAKMQTREQQFIDDFENHIHQVRECHISYQNSSTISRMWFRIGAAIALALLVSASLLVEGTTIAQLLVLVLIFGRLMPLTMEVQQSYLNSQFLLPAYQSINKLLEESLANQESLSVCETSQIPFSQEIRLSGVRFSYSKNSIVLDDINLVIKANTTTIVSGPSGAGKSTLVDLLVGLLSPEDGKITCDDREINDANLRQWRRQIAYVSQDVYLYHDTIRFNLTWGDPAIDDAKLWHVLDKVAARDFVRAFPDGLDTVVGNRGSNLSGGERQRIALARALLQKPQLLVLDEAASALDEDNRARLQQTLDSLHGRLTLVVVTHQIHQISRFDKIIRIENGRIVAQQGSRSSIKLEAVT